MQLIEKVKTLILPLFDEEVKLYDVEWVSNEHTLRISAMKKDGSMDLDTCAMLSEKISAILDENDPIESEYTLEVCSPGAEREIKDLNELEHLVGSYVYVAFHEAVKKLNDVTGEIVSVDGDDVSIAYRDKSVKRTIVFTKENIRFIRMAVKL